MRKTLSILSLAGLLAVGLHAESSNHAAPGVAPDAAWHMLALGNDRFAAGLTVAPHRDAALRRDLAGSQRPWAVVVSDADSRVTPEFVFDLGMGDLYVVRNAASIIKSAVEVASVEYAVEHLGTRLVVVLGHSGDGVVRDVLGGGAKNGSGIGQLAVDIAPAIDEARDKVAGLSGDTLENSAVEKNVLLQMKRLLQQSPGISGRVESGKIKVIGGIYNLETGRVRWLGEHPSQEDILEGKKP